jgi:hypothetical protein
VSIGTVKSQQVVSDVPELLIENGALEYWNLGEVITPTLLFARRP